jgi:AcrR family transcriptional regulator
MTVRRDREATRTRLLDAARTGFAERGYDGVSVRSVATAAGVDAALVFRYFGSKDGLFVAATSAVDPATLLGSPPAELAERLLELFAFSSGPRAAAIVALLRSGGQTAGHRRLQAAVCEPYVAALADDDSPDSELRAELIIAWVLGVASMRHLVPGTRLRGTDLNAVQSLSQAVVATLLGTSGSAAVARPGKG